MNTPSPIVTVRVSGIRSQNLKGNGGAIFTGIEVDSQGWRTDAKTHLVIKAPRQILPTRVERGQLWRISGAASTNTIIVNNYKLTELTVDAEELELLRPSGEHIITLLSEGEAFAGIGQAKARRMWDHFGEELYGVLDRSEVERLVEIMPQSTAERLVESWSQYGQTLTLQWLQSKSFPVSLGRKLLEFYGEDARTKIEEDPYRLISFAASWKAVDSLAQNTFGILPHDPRRLAGGVDEVLYAAFDAGNTCLHLDDFKRRLTKVLTNPDEAVVESALQAGKLRGCFITRADHLHAPGPFLMETTLVEAIVERMNNSNPLMKESQVAAILDAYEEETRLQTGDTTFHLNEKQREAIQSANANSFGVITGSAGTGKTTVLRALFRVCEAAGYGIYAMALSGRAAKRISEATGHRAQTIAGFLKHFTRNEAPDKALVVIDEASMVDLPSIYRVIRSLPTTYRIVLVGDPYQLPPVGPGLLLHELVHNEQIPVVELKEIRRHGGEIARAATLIRTGQWPDLGDNTAADILFVSCSYSEINSTVLRLYDEDRSATQILCATRNSRAGGVMSINSMCQRRVNSNGTELLFWNSDLGQPQPTGFRVADPVICLRNNWEIDLQNGSLGVILAAAHLQHDSKKVLGSIRWDNGQVRDLTEDLLQHVALAYAITIHKSQGSAFRRVIVPVTQNKLLDRTLLYTAVTRAEQQVVLVGDVAAAQKAVGEPRRSDGRQVALCSLLRERLNAESLPISS